MSMTTCPTCGGAHNWSWEEAFDKFGFGDGDGLVMTHHVAKALRDHGYTVTAEPWGCHNVTITSIETKEGVEQILEAINLGYDDARDYLPKPIVELLDAAFPSGTEVVL